MLPNASHAIIEPSKARDCLLSPIHPIGRFKAHPDGHPNSSTCGHLKLLHPERGLRMG